MARKQKNRLATHPEVSPRGPLLSLPRRDDVEKLSRELQHGARLLPGKARFCAGSLGQEQCQEGWGQRLMEGPLWKPGPTAASLPVLLILPG